MQRKEGAVQERGVLDSADGGEPRAAKRRMRRPGRDVEARGREAGSSGGRHCNLLALGRWRQCEARWW
jgi:hypothetical protein